MLHILYTIDISWTNITRYCIQHSSTKYKASVKRGTYENTKYHKCFSRILERGLQALRIHFIIMAPSNGNICRVIGPLCGEFTGHRWIPCTKASDAELWCFLWSGPEPTVEQTMETLVIRDATALIVTSLQWLWYTRPCYNKSLVYHTDGNIQIRLFTFLQIGAWIRHSSLTTHMNRFFTHDDPVTSYCVTDLNHHQFKWCLVWHQAIT